jgi:hypothetical protein
MFMDPQSSNQIILAILGVMDLKYRFGVQPSGWLCIAQAGLKPGLPWTPVVVNVQGRALTACGNQIFSSAGSLGGGERAKTQITGKGHVVSNRRSIYW